MAYMCSDKLRLYIEGYGDAYPEIEMDIEELERSLYDSLKVVISLKINKIGQAIKIIADYSDACINNRITTVINNNEVDKQEFKSIVRKISQCVKADLLLSKVCMCDSTIPDAFIIKYKAGIENNCTITDWDYKSMTVRLSMESTNAVVELCTEETTCEKSTGNIVEIMNKFNGLEFNRLIGVELECYNIGKELLKPKFSSLEVSRLAKKEGIKLKISAVDIYRDISEILVISLWDIDNSIKNCNHKIDISIPGRKVLDLKSGSFIYDKNIINSILDNLKKKAGE